MPGSGGTYTLTGTAATVTSELDALTFTPVDGSPGTSMFILSDSDTSAGMNSDRTSTTIDSVACYCIGTLILTVRGEVPVEDLRIGDFVATAGGSHRPIKWIGRRSYLGRFASRNVLPICIKAGALDDSTPSRDLWISPHHAMYLDGVLIEAKDLVNGVSVVQAEYVDEVAYVHVELDSHDVIFAEAAASESYFDDGNRMMFHNAMTYYESHPHEAYDATATYCAPRIEEGYELEAVRTNIAARAGLVAALAPATPLRGFVDPSPDGSVAGWAQNVDHPEAPVCLDIYVDGKLLGRVLANVYRADLKEAGLGSGHHSFTFRLPAGFAVSRIIVCRSSDGAALERSHRCEAETRQAA